MKTLRPRDGTRDSQMIERNLTGIFRASAVPLALVIAALILGALVASCSGGEEPSPTPAPTVTATPQPAPTPAPTPEPTAPAAGGVTVSLSEASVARYLVGEQLARLSMPNDAIGETPDVSGSMVFDMDGKVDYSKSVVTVGLAGLKSDESRRDGYVRNRVFDTSQYPDAELVVTDVVDMPWPLPESGEVTFLLIGDFTVRDVTTVTKWDVTAEISGGTITGQAKTVLTFDQLNLSKPSFSFILSVEDEIRLELDIEAEISGG